MTSDISKAFLMVGLNEEDRDCCRFFWPEDPFNPRSKILVYRFRVVLFGSTASQFLLNATIHHHLKSINDSVSNDILRNIYVDNLQNSFNSESELIEFYNKSKIHMQDGGFHLKEWRTNANVLNEVFIKDGVDLAENNTSVLGLKWDSNSDSLSICVDKFESLKSQTITKRQVISDISSIFDPYGYLLPLTVRGKFILQDIWKENIAWDSPISGNILTQWLTYANDMTKLSSYTFPRKMPEFVEPTLHIFSDSSSKAYGAVAYFVEGDKVQFLMSKSRLVPLKSPPSIPQLELTAVNIAARLSEFVHSTFDLEFKISETVLWTDSQIVLHWLNSSKITKPYVYQRVNNIKELCPNASFNHVQSCENPCDLLTRGVSVDKFFKTDLWMNGPEWLTNCDNRPRSNNVDSLIDSVVCDVAPISESVSNHVPSQSDSLIDVKRFSSYSKLIGTTTRLFASIRKFKSHFSQVHDSCNDLERAERFVIQEDQKREFPEIYNALLSQNKNISPLAKQLKLFMKDGIIRSSGRIGKSDLDFSEKYPVLLSNKSYLTTLLISDVHNHNLHCGVNEVLAHLRERFWIIKARQCIKSVLRKCVSCLKVQGRPLHTPPMPDLPYDRVRQANSFEITGVDYTGNINVKSAGTLIKAYIVLFTCFITRAVHLEVVTSLSEKDFIDSFIRFSSRRGLPKLMFSDNAANFVGSAKTLQNISNDDDFYKRYRVKWNFIIQRAPWRGGVWERLVGMTKNSLKKVVGKSLITLEELNTIIVQIESRLNDRPLTYICDDNRDQSPLTPSHLIFGRRIICFPYINTEELDDPSFCVSSHENLSNRQLYCQSILNDFWKRWRREYLTSLRERMTLCKNSNNLIKPGQIVLIHDDCPRVSWKMGKISELLPSDDNVVRSVSLITQKGVLYRPVNKLYPLEVRVDEEIMNENHVDINSSSPNPIHKLPRRLAAIEALKRIKSNLRDDSL